jgi:hypothetical protein
MLRETSKKTRRNEDEIRRKKFQYEDYNERRGRQNYQETRRFETILQGSHFRDQCLNPKQTGSRCDFRHTSPDNGNP